MKETIKALESWDEASKCLKLIGECELTLDTIEADMNLKINDAKTEAEKLGKPLKDKIKLLKSQLEDFTEEHKAEIEGKTKVLTFGKCGFRQSTTISVPTKKIDKVIANLKKFGMQNCIKFVETVNKDVIATYSDKDIAKVGATRKIEDKFWCEADKEKIRG